MKKFLSLVLALVMTMSLVTISAGAKDFTDDEKITYEEAVAVMSEVKVLDGYTDGSFKPQGELTRGAAAKIICNMILGPTTAAELHADTAPYKDVPVDHTFAGYIAYCAKEGIISGYADGTFRPAAPLTGYAFMKMLLGALGYDQDVEGFTGANWSINVAKRALGIGLNAGLQTEFSGIKSVTREEAALYAFNTLCATMVDYDSKTTVTVGGAEVVVAGSTAKDVLWTGTKNADGNVKDDNKVQFAEKYFSKLVAQPDEDVFGRPSTKWVYNKTDIGSYVDYEKLAADYTAKVEGGDVYSDIGSNAADYALTYYVNGVKQDKKVAAAEAAKLEKKNDEKMLNSGKGVLTEVYVDNDNEELTIVSINTYLGIVASDYSEKNETLRVKYYKDKAGTTKTVKLEDVANLADFADGDVVLVTVADGVVVSMAEPETVSDVTITVFSTDDGSEITEGKQVTKITADGTKYEASVMAWWEAALVDNYSEEDIDDCNFNLYLDPYGYVIGIEAIDLEDQYVFVVGYDVGSSVLSSAVDKANLITIDGTMVTADVKLGKNMSADTKALFNQKSGKIAEVNHWFKYTMDGDVYVLEDAVVDQTVYNFTEINSENDTFTAGSKYVFGNAKTTYIMAETDAEKDSPATRITGVEAVGVGIKNVDIAATGDKLGYLPALNNKCNAYAMYKGGFITYAVVLGEEVSNTNNLVFITSTKVIDKEYVKDVGYVYTYECIKNGEADTIQMLKDAEGITSLAANKLFKVSFDKNGYGEKMVEIIDNNDKHNELNGLNTTALKKDPKFAVYAKDITITEKEQTIYLVDTLDNSAYVLLDDECVFWVKNTDEANGGNGEWQKFVDVEDALDELGDGGKQLDKGNFVIIADDDTGFATCIIMLDTAYDLTQDTPTGDGSYGVYAIAGDRSWTDRTGTANFVFGFSQYDADNNTYDVMDAADIVSLGLKASDFTVTINGETYVGQKIVTFAEGSTADLKGYVKVNFGVDEIILNGFRYQETDGTVNKDSNIDFSFSVKGVKVSQAKTLIETGLANFG